MVVTKNRQIVELLNNTAGSSISTQPIVYKAKSSNRYRNIIGGAARPRKEIPDTNMIDALQILEENPGELDLVSINMRNNEEVVLAAVQQNFHALRFASDEMRNNQVVVLAAIQQNVNALRHASDEMRNNLEVVLAAVQQHGWALQFASDETDMFANKHVCINKHIRKITKLTT